MSSLTKFANSLNPQERNDLLNSDSEDVLEPKEDFNFKIIKDNYQGRAEKILDYYMCKNINGHVLKISNKLYQVKIPKITNDLNDPNFNLLESIDFQKPFIKEFSNAKLEVLKKSFEISSKNKKTIKFPTNFVPFNNKKKFMPSPANLKIDFKPLFKSKPPHIIQKKNPLINFSQNNPLLKLSLIHI